MTPSDGVFEDALERLRAAGAYDPASEDASDRRELIRFNLEHGVSVDEMIEAAAEDRLAYVVVDPVIRGEDRRMTLGEVAEQTGWDREEIAKMWRAAGFPTPEPEAAMFPASDVATLELIRAAQKMFGEEVTLQLTRVVGSSIARIAEAEVAAVISNVGGPDAEESGNELAIARTNLEISQLLPRFNEVLEIAHRHHLEAAIRRLGFTLRGSLAGESRPKVVGFADLVGFTSLSRELSSQELARAIADFDAHVNELVTRRGGRVVKLIGDEAMFVMDDPTAACELGLELAGSLIDHPVLPALRVGLGFGDVLAQDGDYFGPVVNLAARAVRVARAETVLVPAEIRDAVEEVSDAYYFRPLPPRRVKGFEGRVKLYALRRAES